MLLHIEYLAIELKCKNKNLVITNIYHPPNISISESIKKLSSLFEHLTTKNTDHNIDLLKVTAHTRMQKFPEIYIDMNLYPSITKPTRVTHASAILIFPSVNLHNPFSQNRYH